MYYRCLFRFELHAFGIVSVLLIEKVHLDDLDLYVVTSAVVATSVFL